MKGKEASKINQYLASISGVNKDCKLFIDNLHYPYFEFDRDYTLPSISTLDGVDKGSALIYLKEISSLIPELINHTNILPEPRPKKDNHRIYLTKAIKSNLDQKFIWLLALDVGYLGGATPDKILQGKTQGRSISIRTNRIYFKSLVIPVESILYERDEIRNFDPYEIKELLNDISSDSSSFSPVKPFSELFDEADYSTQEEAIHKFYKLDSGIWQPGKIYYPLGVDYLSIGFRFLETRFPNIQNIWNKVSPEVWSWEERENFPEISEYLSGWESSPSTSPSGNLRWQLQKKRNKQLLTQVL